MKKIFFIVPDFGNLLTGGTLYNDKVSYYLKKKYLSVIKIKVPKDSKSLALHKKIKKLPRESTIILDGYLANKLKIKTASNLKILVHHPCSLENSDRMMSDIKLFLSEKKAFNMGDSFITVSKTMKNVLIKYIGAGKKICVAYPGIDNKFYKLKNDKESKNIISVGNVIPRKGYTALIKALCNVEEDFSLTIIGSFNRDSEYFKNLIKIIDENNLQQKVKFVGSLDFEQVLTHIEKSRLFVLPTRYEGFGMSIVESAAAGLDIITSDIPVLREVLKNATVDFIPEFDVNQITLAINRNLSKSSGSTNNFTRRYKWENTASKIMRSL